MRELVITSECEFEGDPKPFYSHYRHRSHERTDRDINKWVGCAMLWGDPVDEEQGEYKDSK